MTERKWLAELAAAVRRDEEPEVTPESADAEAKKIVEAHSALFEKIARLEYYVYVRTSLVLLPPQASPPRHHPP